MNQSLWTIRNLTWAYLLLFVLLVGMNYMPFIVAENGKVFGFFRLEHAGNVLHVISGIWALLAALTTRGAQLFYFRVFGTAYFIDGVVGVSFGSAYLNGNIFDSSHTPVADMATRFVVNTPHLVIGGLAMFIGFYLCKKIK
ncbi:MAG TPA: hypothetical protein VFB99_02675 [Vicinamibacterales bacterium]|nr:hypothetical protein [Vicinamibacterales bacterium]